jgi:cytochrome c
MSFELNKILGALLTALIIAFLTGLIAEGFVSPEKLAKDAYPIPGGEVAAAEPAAAAAPAKPDPIPADMWAHADAAHGEEIAKKCQQCHNFEKGAGNKIGPDLYGVIGRPRASVEGFSYSDALKKLGGTWTPQEIAAFIFKPSAYAPGTKMSFIGLPKPEDRADVEAFLNKDSDSPIDLSKAQ